MPLGSRKSRADRIQRRESTVTTTRITTSIGLALMMGLALGPRSADADILSDAFITVREGNATNAKIGFAVATAGDVNGDGYSDVLLHSPAGNGTAWCYHGAATGIEPAPAWTITGSQQNAFLGLRPSTAGDVNADGYDDVIVGTPQYSNGQPGEGAVSVYLGSASGLSMTPQRVLEGDVASLGFGSIIDTAGDVNGDGFDDIIIGVPNYANGQSFEGRALVYFGSESGVAATPAWTFESEFVDAHFGQRVASAGDMNGDGFDDIIVSAPDLSSGQTGEGRVYLFRGSASGPTPLPIWMYESNVAGGRCGWGLGLAGDINADGYSDIAFDTGNFNPATSAVLVFFGGAGGPAAVPSRTYPNVAGGFADVLYTAGDVNGDGCADLVANYVGANNNTGEIWILGGSETGPTLPALATRSGQQASENFGWDARPAGDVNGDGYGDVIAGAPFCDNGQTDEGVVRLFLGKASLPPPQASWARPGIFGDALFAWSVAQGDWNGDGFTDLALGEPQQPQYGPNTGDVIVTYGGETGYDQNGIQTIYGSGGGRFGYSVANAGDVDGDGDDELVVGEPYSGNSDFPDVGAAHLFNGSPTGLDYTPSWTVTGGILPAHFGYSVAGAGDFNGDGYADVLVGAPDYSFGTQPGGKSFLFLGSSTGLTTTFSWSAWGTTVGDRWGASVSGAGDANGDGYADIIIGAPNKENGQTDEGYARVVFGAPTGISGSWNLEIDQAGANLGFAVSSVGDVNADGFCDIIVGAPNYDAGGQLSRGYATVYLGSADNVLDQAWWKIGDAGGDVFGAAVSGGGDVNNDGYSDVLVGAPLHDAGGLNAGGAFLYLGNATGLDVNPSWMYFDWDDQSQFGFAVSCAGDATGDGFGDLIIGEPMRNDRGTVWAFYGGRAGLASWENGVLKKPRQLLTDATTPIMLGGISDEPSSFVMRILGRSARGRSSIRTEYQVASAGSGWSGAPRIGPAFETGVPVGGIGSAASASVNASNLIGSTAYHWRIRFTGDSPYFPHTPWHSMPGNGAGATDLRTAPGATDVAGDGAASSVPATLLAPHVGPNPCRDEATIAFALPAAGIARVTVHDVTGRRVATLLDAALAAGAQSVQWDVRDEGGRRVAAGLYLVRLEHGASATAAKLVVRR
jgi:FG-GAP repeat